MEQKNFGINKDCRSMLCSVTSALQMRALCSYIPHIYSKWFVVCFIHITCKEISSDIRKFDIALQKHSS